MGEALAVFRGTGTLNASMLIRLGRPLALAELEVPDDASVVDLDDPKVLGSTGLRPSRVATRHRPITQGIAADIYRADDAAVALRWWSTIESTWINWTLFDRAGAALTLVDIAELRIDDPIVRDAAELLGFS